MGRSCLPAAVQDAQPLEGQGAKRCLVRTALVALLSIERAGPVGPGDRLSGPFDKGLAQKRRALPAPMDPALVATALSDRCDARILLKIGRASKALALLTEGDQQARC